MLILLILFSLEFLQITQQHGVLPVTQSIARCVAWLLQSFDNDVIARGKILADTKSGFSVTIEAGCNGLEALIVLYAGVLAYPCFWRYRLGGLVFGLITIQALNIIRIISLFYLGQWKYEWFQWAHLYLWQPLIMLDVLLSFLIWLEFSNRHYARKQAI